MAMQGRISTRYHRGPVTLAVRRRKLGLCADRLAQLARVSNVGLNKFENRRGSLSTEEIARIELVLGILEKAHQEADRRAGLLLFSSLSPSAQSA